MYSALVTYSALVICTVHWLCIQCIGYVLELTCKYACELLRLCIMHIVRLRVRCNCMQVNILEDIIIFLNTPIQVIHTCLRAALYCISNTKDLSHISPRA